MIEATKGEYQGTGKTLAESHGDPQVWVLNFLLIIILASAFIFIIKCGVTISMTPRGGVACAGGDLGTIGTGAAAAAGAMAVADGVAGAEEATAVPHFLGVVAAPAEAVPAEDGNHEREPIHRHDCG